MTFEQNFNQHYPEVCKILLEIASKTQTGDWHNEFRMQSLFISLVNGVHLSDECKEWLKDPHNSPLAEAAIFSCALYPLLVTKNLLLTQRNFWDRIEGIDRFQMNLLELIAKGVRANPKPETITSFINRFAQPLHDEGYFEFPGIEV